MGMRRKTIQAIICWISVLFVLAGCAAPVAPSGTPAASEETSTSGPSGEIVMWRFPLMDDQDQETAVWNSLIESFNETYPDVTVTIETQPWDDRRQKLLSAIGSGRGPDVFYINPDMISLFADGGAIVSISDFVTEEELAKYNPGTLIPWGGKLYALPILQNSIVHVYNTDLVSSIGLDPAALPTTIEEFEQWAVTAKENDLFISTWAGNTATSGLTALIWQFGGDVYGEDGSVIINSPETVAAMTFLKKMYDEGWIPPDSVTGGDDVELFRGQKVLAVLTDGNRFYGSQETYVDNFAWAFGPILSGERQVTSGTVGSYAVSSNAESPELAVAWIKHVTDSANSVAINKTVGYLPPLKDAPTYYEGEEGFQTLLERAAFAQVDPIFPSASQAYLILAEEAQAIMTGSKTPEDGVASMQERIEKAAAEVAQ
ncbi:MAG: sugar ABC transporter substrate-binding protein [Caldilineaceae bacterium]|nr:sugar ABC transporter substrate-binding protein [Caldilineaceae bacterium]